MSHERSLEIGAKYIKDLIKENELQAIIKACQYNEPAEDKTDTSKTGKDLLRKKVLWDNKKLWPREIDSHGMQNGHFGTVYKIHKSLDNEIRQLEESGTVPSPKLIELREEAFKILPQPYDEKTHKKKISSESKYFTEKYALLCLESTLLNADPKIPQGFINHIITNLHQNGFLDRTSCIINAFLQAHGFSLTQETIDLDDGHTIYPAEITVGLSQEGPNEITLSENMHCFGVKNAGLGSFTTTEHPSTPILTLNNTSTLIYDPKTNTVSYKITSLEISSTAVAPQITEASTEADKAIKWLIDALKPKLSKSTFQSLLAKLPSLPSIIRSKSEGTQPDSAATTTPKGTMLHHSESPAGSSTPASAGAGVTTTATVTSQGKRY